MTDFKKLKVWQKAHVMALDAHRVAGQIRGAKHASLRSQIIRAAMSYHLLAARDLGAVRASDSLTLISQVIEVRKMLYGLLRYLATRSEDRSRVPPKATTQA